MQKYFFEIIGGVILSSIFSLFTTAFIGNAIGLQPELTTALIPRCITVALALPIASLVNGE